MQNTQRKAQNRQQGQAVIASVIFLVLLSVVIITGFATPLTRELKSARATLNSRQSYFAAESGVEDAAYRLKNKLTYTSSYNLTVGGAATAVTIGSSGNARTITASGNDQNHQRKLSTQLDLSSVGGQFFYGIQVGDGGLRMENGSIVNGSGGSPGSVYSNGNIVCEHGTCTITGDAIVAGGLNVDPNVEWTANNTAWLFASTSVSQDIAQSFTATAGALNKVSVFLGKIASPGNLILRLSTDNSGKPSDDNGLASATILSATVGTNPSWIDVAFATPPTLIAGTKYWIVLDYDSNSTTNYWNWRRDTTDGYVDNTGKYTGACCSGNPTWKNVGGDLAFRVWIGGVNTKIDGLTISGTGRTNVFVNTICGSGCVVDNPSRAELPISDGVIQDWRDEAALGGTINNDYSINGSASLGPKKIAGNLTVNLGNDQLLTVTGTIWVTGNIVFGTCGNSTLGVKLDSGYGANSGVIIADGEITVGNGCPFAGSGDPKSFPMVLSTKNALTSAVMTVNNNSTGVIYYANHGRIKLNQNAKAKEVTAYGIEMENNSTVTYESGLSDLNFSSGPGGSFEITKWQETQ